MEIRHSFIVNHIISFQSWQAKYKCSATGNCSVSILQPKHVKLGAFLHSAADCMLDLCA